MIKFKIKTNKFKRPVFVRCKTYIYNDGFLITYNKLNLNRVLIFKIRVIKKE
jgi:phage regulator Rha-like protein